MGNNQSDQLNRADVMMQGYEEYTYVEFEKKWFAEGAFRLVYRGTFYGDPRLKGKQCVVKVAKEPYSLDLEEYAWEADKRAYEKAIEMAQLFNNVKKTSKPIQFLEPEFTNVNTRAASEFLGYTPYKKGQDDKNRVTVAVERYLEGSYVKFLSNTGCVTPKEMATPAAFSHFSYHASDGEILVCDLQGVRTDTSYKLTDPAVHNGTQVSRQYGLSDLGKLGIVKFFSTHKCNSLCEGLKKPKRAHDCTADQWIDFEEQLDKIPVESSTVHTYQLEKSGISKVKLEQIQNNLNLEAS